MSPLSAKWWLRPVQHLQLPMSQNKTSVSTTPTSLHLIQWCFVSILGVFIWQQKGNFIAAERQEKSLFMEMKWRKFRMDNGSALLTAETTSGWWRELSGCQCCRLWLLLALSGDKRQEEPLGRAFAWAHLTQGASWAQLSPVTSFLWAQFPVTCEGVELHSQSLASHSFVYFLLS